MTMQDIVNLSGLKLVDVALAELPRTVRPWRLAYKALGETRVPFPPNTKGVFYFHDRTSVHPVAGEVRFRVLPMDTVQDSNSINIPELFGKGHDLLDHYGFRPWGSSLLSIVRLRRTGLYEFMRAEGYITDEAGLLVQRMKLAFPDNFQGARGQVLEQITDPFIMDLSKHEQAMVVLQNDEIVPFRLYTRTMTLKWPPPGSSLGYATHYSGILLVRLEVIRHGDHTPVVVRVLKFLRPPNQSDVVVQEEGVFLKKYDPINKVETVWQANRKSELRRPAFLEQLYQTYLANSP